MYMHPLLLKVARGYRFIPLDEIIAVEAKDRYAVIILSGGEHVPVFHDLRELAVRLKCGHAIHERLFWRIHRSYIAGLHHAVGLSPRRKLTLSTGLELPVSRDQFRELLRTCGTVR